MKEGNFSVDYTIQFQQFSVLSVSHSVSGRYKLTILPRSYPNPRSTNYGQGLGLRVEILSQRELICISLEKGEITLNRQLTKNYPTANPYLTGLLLRG